MGERRTDSNKIMDGYDSWRKGWAREVGLVASWPVAHGSSEGIPKNHQERSDDPVCRLQWAENVRNVVRNKPSRVHHPRIPGAREFKGKRACMMATEMGISKEGGRQDHKGERGDGKENAMFRKHDATDGMK